MPFTFSHPAAVLPVRLRWLHFPALIVGSMMPDLGYYMPVSSYFKANNHTLTHLVSFCIPMGIVALALAIVLRRGFVFTLPEPHRSAARAAHPLLTRGRLWTIPLSLLIGALTHIAWDRACDVHTRYRPLEVLSSIVGLLAIGWSYLQWLRHHRQHTQHLSDAWRYIAWLTVFIGGWLITRRWGFRMYHYAAYADMRRSALDSLATLVSCTLGVMLVMICASAIYVALVDESDRIS